MPILLPEDTSYPLPEMLNVHQIFDDTKLDNVKETLEKSLHQESILRHLRPGMRVAVAVGSRGIDHLPLIVRTVLDFLKAQGTSPFIVSAMGSHGGGTEKGQKEVLAGYGITEEAMGVPVCTSVDTVFVGSRSGDIPVWFDRAASEADLIVPVNRVKLHTDFAGELQSGLCKMLVIGLGNQKGCSLMHETSPKEFASALEEAARLILKKEPVGFGVAILENAHDHTRSVEAIPAECLVEREKELVVHCLSNMPFIRIKHADILIVDEIGKDISGAGYDPNILGRSSLLYTRRLPVPDFQRMVLLGLSANTHGNAIGLGQFDVITRNVIDNADWESIYANALAVRAPEDARVPIVTKDRDEAIRVALKCCRNVDYKNLRILEIKNTLDLSEIKVSPAMLDEVRENPDLELVPSFSDN